MKHRQITLARHALGLPNDRRRSYRNRYFAPAGMDVENEWNDMVSHGWAERGDGIRSIAFWLTRSGAEMALDPGESLDMEDFALTSAKGEEK